MSAQFNPMENVDFKENIKSQRIKTSLSLKPDKRHFNINPNVMSPSSSASGAATLATSAQTRPAHEPPIRPFYSSPSSSTTSFMETNFPKSSPHNNHPNPTHSTTSKRGRSTRIKPLNNRLYSSLDSAFRFINRKDWELWITKDSKMRVESDDWNENRVWSGLSGGSQEMDGLTDGRSYDDQWKSWIPHKGTNSSFGLQAENFGVENDALWESEMSNFVSSKDPDRSKATNPLQNLPYTVETLEFQVPGDFFSSIEKSESLDLSKEFNTASVETVAEPRNPNSNSRFAPAPRNTSFSDLLPIMSRLPSELVDSSQLKLEEDLISQLENSTDYLTLTTSKVPYTRSHLPTLDPNSIELWKVLHDFRVIKEDYSSGYLESRSKKSALAPHPISSDSSIDECPAFASSKSSKAISAVKKIRDSFNWNELELPEELEGKWYGVAFRSARKFGSESLNLYEADRKSHEEAVNSGGLMMYWYGSPSSETGENLATCIWTNRREAKIASSLPLHAEAAKHALPAYQVFDLTRYSVLKLPGEKKVRIEMWEDEQD